MMMQMQIKLYYIKTPVSELYFVVDNENTANLVDVYQGGDYSTDTRSF